jgi:hypothetical protein
MEQDNLAGFNHQPDLENAASVPQPTEPNENTTGADAIEQVLIPMPEDAPRGRPRDRNKRRPQRPKREYSRYITVLWSGQREPVDDMYLCDIAKNGEWLTVTTLEQVRTRREILEYLKDVDSGLIGLEFPFSFPSAFLEFVKPEIKTDDWRGLIKRVREDVKKNLDDGIRLWIERIGRYRESQLVPEEEERQHFRGAPDRRRNNRGLEPLPPYERRSMAERFRRTEHNIRRPAEGFVTSSLQIGYNRLTSRYEFGDARQRGRAALLGMSMLDQLLEAKEDLNIWPWSAPGGLTIVEVQPWLFTRGKVIDPAECRKLLTAEEDNALEIEPHFKDLACRNPQAQQALMTTLGMIKAEGRVERAIRPLRDYPAEFYSDEKVRAEGWYYGVGYKPEGAEKREDRSSRNKGNRSKGNPSKVEGAVDESLPADLDKAAVVPQPPETVQTPEVIESRSEDLDPQTPQS